MARKKKHEEHENAERWLVSYADFITLLFAFFTVLYAMGQNEKGKMQQAMQSIRASFLSGGGLFSDDGNTFLPNLRPGAEGANEGANSTDAALDKIAASLAETRSGAADANQGGAPFEVTRAEGGLLVRLNDEVSFKPGRGELNAEAKKTLEQLGTKVRDLGVPVEVTGYAARDAYTSDPKAWNLALQRAVSVASFMASTVPFFPEGLKVGAKTEPAIGRGASQSSHRRVEIFLKVSDQDVTRLVSSIGG